MDNIGLLKYEGDDLQDGVISSLDAEMAIRGFDKSLQWILARQDPSLGEIEMSTPISIRKGSWEIELPSTVGHWLLAAGGIGFSAYLAKAAQKLAERDFDAVGLKDIFSAAFVKLKEIVKIAIHLKGLGKAHVKKLKWREDNKFVELEGNDGSAIVVKYEDLKAFLEIPSGKLSDLVYPVREGRSLNLISRSPEDTVVVLPEHRPIFVVDDDDDSAEILFPELQHGDQVLLEGFVTRGNEVANSIGFRYLDHILTCYPISGSIVRFKPLLFTACAIDGVVSRIDDKGHPNAHRPKINFERLIPMRQSEDFLNLDS